LDSVNAKEAAKHAPGLNLEGLSETAWRGSGEVRVVAIELVNGQGNSSGFLLSGEPGTIRIHYRADESVSRVGITVVIGDQRGSPLLTVGSRDQELFEIRQGKGYVDFQMDELLLAGGNYLVRTVTEVDGHVVEALDEGIEFTVRSPRAGIGGAFIQHGQWRHIAI
jgi:ABC-2 type transport system ATP-binding protein/lipopolysaccharide transport system ATP-binding protein